MIFFSWCTWPRNIIVTAWRCAVVYDEKLEKPHTLGTGNIVTLCPLSPQKCKLLWTIIWLCMPCHRMPHRTHAHAWMAQPQRLQVVQTSECASQQTIAVSNIRKNQLFLLHLTTSYSSYFRGKKGVSGNKTSFFLLMPSWGKPKKGLRITVFDSLM